MSKSLNWKWALIVSLVGVSIWQIYPIDKKINLGLDLKGGVHLVLKIDTAQLDEDTKRDVQDRAVEVIRNRIDQFGVREASIQKQGGDGVVVQLPGVKDRARAIDLVGKTALLEFKLVSDNIQDIQNAIAGKIPEGWELLKDEDGKPILVKKVPELDGRGLKNASVKFDQSKFGEPIVGVTFNPEGTKKFAQITADNVGRRLAIILDGVVKSAPVINEPIPSGEAVISGRFTTEQATDLAIVLRVGALPAALHIEEERTIGPLLGRDSINKGIKASIIGLVLVFVFMVSYYLFAGLVAAIALVLNLFLILGGLGLLPNLLGVSATLTLPGIAGIILSLGMAVDANVLINERIREELATGKTLAPAISSGYQKAFSAILDSNLTTLLAAFFLFQFGTGPIRGFAVTLIIGLCASMFTAIVVTRTILETLLSFKILKNLPMLKLIGKTKIDFIAKRRIFYALSLLVILVGMVFYFRQGPKAYGIDFVGGQIQEYRFKEAPKVDAVRSALKDIGLGDAYIQQFREDPRTILIRTPLQDKDVFSQLKEKFPGQEIDILRIEKVGPVAGKILKVKAMNALAWSLLGILVYVAFRFKHLNFAVAGIIALFHDVLVALGFTVLTKRPIDLLTVTALLTIAGYSINDTIVIYDRVRENSRIMKNASLYELINLSVNQTLGRTILTSGVTLLVVLALLFYGGDILKNFAFTLFVGFISGVYSTIYIASPLVLAWSKKGKNK